MKKLKLESLNSDKFKKIKKMKVVSGGQRTGNGTTYSDTTSNGAGGCDEITNSGGDCTGYLGE